MVSRSDPAAPHSRAARAGSPREQASAPDVYNWKAVTFITLGCGESASPSSQSASASRTSPRPREASVPIASARTVASSSFASRESVRLSS